MAQRKRALALLFLGCANQPQPLSLAPRLAEVEQLRVEIAHPDVYPVRHGLEIDYGGLDVFVVKLVVRGVAWVPQVISWQQRGRK